MAFKIQDLMTDVTPETIRWATCPGTSCMGWSNPDEERREEEGVAPEAVRWASCPGDTTCSGWSKPEEDDQPAISHSALGLLRQQLHQTLSVQA